MTGEYEYLLDAYYTAVSYNINLSSAPVTVTDDKSEWQIYKKLLFASALPRYVVLEASVNPLPITGVYLKEQARDFYDSFDIGSDVNLIRSVTTGFEEPAAASVFFGSIIDFKRSKKKSYAEGKGYSGTLFSAGTQHIKDNDLIEDKWFEAEWKLKGDRFLDKEKLQWSFRLGSKFHDNRNIADVIYIGLRRSRTDYKDRRLSWLNNSGIVYKFDLDVRNLNAIQQELVVDKKFPLPNLKVVPTMAVGLIWRDREKYKGDLRDEDPQKLELILRPNIEF